MLYWGEGAKTKRMLALANADPAALRLFVAWARHYHDADADFVLSLHLHQGNCDSAARSYWATELGIGTFHKTFIKPAGTGHRKNKLPYGVCRVLMRRSAEAWLRTMSWIEVLQARFSPIANLSAGSLAQLARATDS